jgi:hypothetical protein
VRLPDSIPCLFGELLQSASPQADLGWTVRVLSHADYSTLVCEIPRYQQLQFAKLLADKGSGSITLPMDDQALWPEPVGPSLCPSNGSFTSLTGWEASGGEISQTQAEGGPAQNGCLLTPSGSASTALLEATNTFAVFPLCSYTVTCEVMSPVGYANAEAGMSWQAPPGTALSTTTEAIGTLVASEWTPVSITVQAPAGAQLGLPVVGESGTPSSSDLLYIQNLNVTYDSGSTCLGDFLLDYEHIWQCWQDGILVFEFFGETVSEQLADQSEQRLATVTGPGIIQCLSWAAAMPPGFPNPVYYCDAIQDGFAEPSTDANGNPLPAGGLDTALWNQATPLSHITLNPLGTCQLTASPDVTYLGASPYNITSDLISAQITPITGTGLDGSQLTQFYVQDLNDSTNYALFGVTASALYCQHSDAYDGKVLTKNLGAYNSTNQAYWQISEDNGVFYFWTSPDGNSWTLVWQVEHHWTCDDLGVYFACSYDQDWAVTMGVTNINSNVITPTSQGNVFWEQPIMAAYMQLLTDAQNRGTIPFVTTRMNEVTDSFGYPWPDEVSVQIQTGTDLFSLLQNLSGTVDADWIMLPGFNLVVALPPVAGTNAEGQAVAQEGVGIGVDRSQSVVVREAAQILTRQRTRARDQVANLVGALDSDGIMHSASNEASILRYNQREQYIETAQLVDAPSLDIAVAAAVASTADETLSWTMTTDPMAAGAVPFEDFDVGDWVGAERPGPGASTVDAVRVIGIAIQVDQTGTQATCELTLQSYRQYIDQQLQYLVNKFGGQFVDLAGTVPITSEGGTGVLPTNVTPNVGLGGLANVTLQ